MIPKRVNLTLILYIMPKSLRYTLVAIFSLLFILCLYLAIPTLPKQIKNEVNGTDYSFGEISFNLASQDYYVNEEMGRFLNVEGGLFISQLYLTNNLNEKDVIIITNGPENSEFIEESFDLLSNPFKHRGVIRAMKDSYQMEGNDVSKIKVDLFKSPLKMASVTKNTLRSGVTTSSVDLRIGNYYYTFTPNIYGDQEGNIKEFLRTVNIR